MPSDPTSSSPGLAEEATPVTERSWPRRGSGVRTRDDLAQGQHLVGEAEHALADGDVDRAATLLVQAIECLEGAGPGLRADAYVRLATVNRRRRRSAAALHCLRKALALTPRSVVAHHELVELHTEWGEWERVLGAEEALFAVLDGVDERVRELLRSGDRWWRRAGDRARARRRYEDALLLDGKCLQAKARLRAIEQQQCQREQLRSEHDAVRFCADPAERARKWLDIAQRQWFSLRSEDDAIEALTQAVDADPSLVEAVELWVEILVHRQRWQALDDLWARFADATRPAGIQARHVVMDGLRSTPPPPSTARMPGQRRRARRTNPWFDQTAAPPSTGRKRPPQSDVYELLKRASDAPPPITSPSSASKGELPRVSEHPTSGVRARWVDDDDEREELG